MREREKNRQRKEIRERERRCRSRNIFKPNADEVIKRIRELMSEIEGER